MASQIISRRFTSKFLNPSRLHCLSSTSTSLNPSPSAPLTCFSTGYSPSSSLANHLTPPFPKFSTAPQFPIECSSLFNSSLIISHCFSTPNQDFWFTPRLLRSLSTSPSSSNESKPPTAEESEHFDNNKFDMFYREGLRSIHPGETPHFKHQEIEEPTVETDLSALANETQEVVDTLMKNMCGVSNVLAALSMVQLGLGAWIAYMSKSAPLMMEISLMTAVAFGFPFLMAVMLRRSFIALWIIKMCILTSTMQIVKSVNFFFHRARIVSYLFIGGLSGGLLLIVLSK